MLTQLLDLLPSAWSQRRPRNALALGFGPFHTGFHPPSNLSAFILRQPSHNGKVELADVCGGIDVLLIGDEIDTQPVELINAGNEFNGGASKTVVVEDEHHIDLAFADGVDEFLVARPFGISARGVVNIFPDNLETTLGGVVAQLYELGFGILSRFVSRDAGVDGSASGLNGHEGEPLSPKPKAPYGRIYCTRKKVLFSPPNANR